MHGAFFLASGGHASNYTSTRDYLVTKANIHGDWLLVGQAEDSSNFEITSLIHLKYGKKKNWG